MFGYKTTKQHSRSGSLSNVFFFSILLQVVVRWSEMMCRRHYFVAIILTLPMHWRKVWVMMGRIWCHAIPGMRHEGVLVAEHRTFVGVAPPGHIVGFARHGFGGWVWSPPRGIVVLGLINFHYAIGTVRLVDDIHHVAILILIVEQGVDGHHGSSEFPFHGCGLIV